MALRTDLAIVQLPATPNVGGLTGANTIITDPNFGTRIVRLTDGASGDGSGKSMQTADDANSILWNTDDTMFITRNTSAHSFIFQFNPTTMQGTQLSGSYTGSLIFSTVSNNIVYNFGPNGFPTVAYKLTFGLVGGVWTLLSTTTLCDFATILPGGFVPLWNGAFAHSHDDDIFSASFGSGPQETGYLCCVYSVSHSGFRMLNTQTGAITGSWGATGTWVQNSPYTNFFLHETFQVPNSSYTFITVSPKSGGGYLIWETATLTLSYLHTGGHQARGYLNYYDGSRGGGQWEAVPYANVNARVNIIPNNELPANQTPPQNYTGDQHGSFGYLSLTDDSIFWVLPYTKVSPFTAAWMAEVHGYQAHGAGQGGPVYRACHSFNTALSTEFIVAQSIGVPSQTGRFLAFCSDWQGTLGANTGGASGILGVNARGDVFVVELSSAGVSPPGNPVITWPTPAPITQGTPLSGTQLDATANVAGSFVYSPASGTVLGVGTQTLSTTFTPTDTTAYNTVSATVLLVVNSPVGKINPVITWPTPDPIVVGIALSRTQLDARGNVFGSFSYSPPSGTVLGIGSYTLSTTFTPTDTTQYNTVTVSVLLVVNATSGGGGGGGGTQPPGITPELTISFHELQFPADLTNGRGGHSYQGGPMFSTKVLISESGKEQRNINWMRSLSKFNVGHILHDAEATAVLLDFFNGRAGMRYGFRFKDWLDYRVDESTGRLWSATGRAPYQLAKLYSDRAGYVHIRPISKPCSGLVADATGYTPPVPAIYIDGTRMVLGADYDLDITTGQVWLASDPGYAALTTGESGYEFTWVGDFDVPVRFETDVQELLLQDYGDTDWPAIQISEFKQQPTNQVLRPFVPASTGYTPILAWIDPPFWETGIAGSLVLAVQLTGPALVNMSIALASSDPTVATLPTPLVINAGISRGTVNVVIVGAGTTTFSATLNGNSVGATFTVLGSTSLAVATTDLPPALVTFAYYATLQAKGGLVPYSWAITGGSLPPGLALNASTGVISGTATGGAATYSFTVTVTDSAAATASASLSITTVVGPFMGWDLENSTISGFDVGKWT